MVSDTQLASMRLGAVDSEIERIQRQKSGNNIFILDARNDVVLGHINRKDVLENTHRASLKDTMETFDMTVVGDSPYTEHLGKRNGLIIPGEDGDLLEFRIYETVKYREGNGILTDVYANATYLDLKKAKVYDPHTTNPMTAIQHATEALNGTEWQVGKVDFAGVRTLTFEEPFNSYDYLKRIAREFDLELRFYVTTDGSQVTGRYVDIVEQVGEWRGRTVEFGADLQGIERIEREDIVTALYGYGPEREDGTRLKVFVEDEEARRRWGRYGRHLVDIYEPESADQDMTEERLQQLTRMELDKRINMSVEYRADISDLENVPGMENKKIRLGDTIRIKDTKFNPALYLEARIHTQERDIFDRASKRVELGDFEEFTEEEVRAIWRQLQEQIRQKISQAELVEYAERKVHRDTTPPENTEHLWLDTSTEPNVLKRYDEVKADWVKATPTEADEVGAETPQGAQDKADQAEQNAKNYTDQTVAPINTRLTEAENAISQAEDDLAQAEQDIIAAQNTLSLITTEHEGQTALYGKVVTNELISENAVITGTFVGANAVFQNITVENAVISGTLDGVDGTFVGSLVGGEIISHASDGGVIEIKEGEIRTALDDAYNQGAVLAKDYLDIYLANTEGAVEFRSRLSYGQLYLSEQFGAYAATFSTKGFYFQGNPILEVGRDQFGTFNGNVALTAVGGGDVYIGNIGTNLLRLERDIRFRGLVDMTVDSDYFRIYATTARGNNIRYRRSDGQVAFYQNGSFRHVFDPSGQKTGGSIEIDGKVWGMSPIDSPQAPIEYFIFDQEVTEEGVTIPLDERFRKATDGAPYAVFTSGVNVYVEKDETSFILQGETQTVDIRIVSLRHDYTDQFWVDMSNV